MMDQTQAMALLRDVLKVGGTLAAIFGYSVGYEQWSGIIMSVAGPLVLVGTMIWTQFRTSKTGLVTSVSALPEVQAMTISEPGLANAARTADPATTVTVGQ